MKRTLTTQLGIIIIVVIFVSMFITSVSNYWVSYEKTYEAAGIEAVGCANITTGLINPIDIEAIIDGDKNPAELNELLDWTTNHKSIFEGQYILSLEGEILALDSNMQKQGFKAGDQFYIDKNVLKTIQETKHPHYSEIYKFGGMKRITGYAPIFKDHDPNKEIIAINAIDFDAKIVTERTVDAVKDSFILGLLPMLIACLITIFIIRRKTKPLTLLINNAQEVAEGDLTVRQIEIKNKDEIGDLATAFNRMTNNLRELINQVSYTTNNVAASAEQLTASSEQTTDATKQIAVTMHEVAAGVDRQVQSIEETSQTVQEMSIGVGQIAGNAQRVSASVTDTAEKASEGGESIRTAESQMNSINHTFSELSELIKGLGNRSEEIGKIIEVITSIASQTNLLALNAAIEAARAGEHGRGFAVVADEVRKLAEQSAGSSSQISELILDIQNETNKAVAAMEAATEEVISGIGIIHTAGTNFDQIEESIKEVTSQIQEVSAAVQQMAAGSEQMVHSMRLISEVAEESKAGTQEVSASTEEQMASMDEISSSASSLANMAEELQGIVNKFKI
ncbi:methyl-accepting chemotaxis protein [Bacillus timonensis]|uniref:methyl-accepting chemotaxis protein n=1 Tax=Bacillus timonensis TaxID=1033734 RepID=UPI0002880DDD|nr:HAMP domain-containing methyl-accepting chemotaxis protein [Bacillus timonensis]